VDTSKIVNIVMSTLVVILILLMFKAQVRRNINKKNKISLLQNQKEMVKYIHEKTGDEYTLVNLQVINATNGCEDDSTMVAYKRNGLMFVRESHEFHQKFKLKTK